MSWFRPIGEVADFVNGLAFTTTDWGDAGKPIIRIQNLTDPDKPFNRTLREFPQRYCVRNGDLLVSWSATLGVYQWAGEEGVLNQHIFKVVPKNGKAHIPYLKHAINASLHKMERFTHGSTMKHINRREFLDTVVWLPAVDEQRRIATVLDQADRVLQSRNQSLQVANTLGRSVFRKFVGSPFENDRDWDVNNLGDHLSFLTSGSRGWAEYYSDSGPRFIRSYDVRMNRLQFNEPIYITPPDNAERVRTNVHVGDVLLTITGSRIGRVSPVGPEVGEAYVSQHVAILRLKPSVDPLYLSWYLSDPAGGQLQIQRAQYGQTKPGLNLQQIKDFEIPVPPIHIQRSFGRALLRVEKIRANLMIQIEESRRLFDGLSQQAFRGEL